MWSQDPCLKMLILRIRVFSIFMFSTIVDLLGLMFAILFVFRFSFLIHIPVSFLLVSFKVTVCAFFFTVGIDNPFSPKEGFPFLYTWSLPWVTISSGLFG